MTEQLKWRHPLFDVVEKVQGPRTRQDYADEGQLSAYDCHYYDRNGKHRIFCTYAKDVAQARLTLEELVGKDLCRVTGIVRVDGFDW